LVMAEEEASETKDGFEPGKIVWVKWGKQFWPARIAKPSEVSAKVRVLKKKGEHLVHFFGSYDYSWTKINALRPWEEDNMKRRKLVKSKTFKRALSEAEVWIKSEDHEFPVWVELEDSSSSEEKEKKRKPLSKKSTKQSKLKKGCCFKEKKKEQH